MNGRPVATKSESTFRMQCGVKTHIAAPPATVWGLLTNAHAFPSWNSTVTRIEGEIGPGQKLALRVPITDRTFKLKVTRFEPQRTMVWSDGFSPMFRGDRTFSLTPRPDGSTDFEMVEVFRGLMMPMIKGSLPDFKPVFEQYAADLKAAAERG